MGTQRKAIPGRREKLAAADARQAADAIVRALDSVKDWSDEERATLNAACTVLHRRTLR